MTISSEEFLAAIEEFLGDFNEANDAQAEVFDCSPTYCPICNHEVIMEAGDTNQGILSKGTCCGKLFEIKIQTVVTNIKIAP